MPERVKIQHLYSGLPSATVRGIYRFINKTSTTEDFLREVRVFLQAEDMASRRESTPITPSPLYHFRDEVPPRTQQVPLPISYVTKEDLEAFGKSLIDKIGRKQTEPERVQQSPWNRGQEGRGRDHSAEDSKNKRSRDGRPICNKCNRPGHIERNCYAKLREETGSVDTKPKVETKSDLDAGPSSKGKN